MLVEVYRTSAGPMEAKPLRLRQHQVIPALLMLGLAAASAWLVLDVPRSLGDYGSQVKPFLDAATTGNWSGFLSGPISEGPLAIDIRLPFVLIAAAFDAVDLVRYQVGVAPFVVIAAILAGAIARRAIRAGAIWPMAALFAGLGLINPFSIKAIAFGHPEELLTAALLVGAMIAAPVRSYWISGGLLGLAIASKQWALIGILPVALAAPYFRIRLLTCAAAIVIVLNAPLVIAHPDRFFTVQDAAASAGSTNSFATVWWPFLHAGPREVTRNGKRIALNETRRTPALVSRLSHPLIVLVPLALILIAWLRRNLTLSNLLALLIAALLIRCVLDPNDIIYYHLPALVALLAWESTRHPWSDRPVPILSVLMATAGWLTFMVLPGKISLDQLNGIYLSWSLSLIAAMIWFAYRRPSGAVTRKVIVLHREC